MPAPAVSSDAPAATAESGVAISKDAMWNAMALDDDAGNLLSKFVRPQEKPHEDAGARKAPITPTLTIAQKRLASTNTKA
jgi:hypothetical protein